MVDYRGRVTVQYRKTISMSKIDASYRANERAIDTESANPDKRVYMRFVWK